MAQRTLHQVTATLIVAKTDSGEIYLDRGATLPASISPDEVKRLLKLNLVKKVATAAPATTDGDPAAAEKAAAEKAAAEGKTAGTTGKS